MGYIDKLKKSVRVQGGMVCALLLAAGFAGTLDHLGAAIALVAGGNILLVGMMRTMEQRRHRALRSLQQNVKALSAEMARSNAGIKKEHKQLTNGIGLVSRQLKDVSKSVSGDDSWMLQQNERQLAIFLRALDVNKREILEGLASEETLAPQGK